LVITLIIVYLEPVCIYVTLSACTPAGVAGDGGAEAGADRSA
jgi:hypothetical protein